MKNAVRTFSLLLLMLLVLSACAPSAPEASTASTDPDSKEGGWINAAVIEDPDSLDPHATIMLTSSSIMAWIYDSLFYIGADGLPQGLLAESWETSEDGKIITIKMREGRMFTDGTPVNAEAVVFTFNRMLDPTTAAPSKSQAGPLETVTALDEYTVEMVFSDPYPPFFFAASGSYFGILSPEAVTTLGDDYGRNPIGSGPFMLDEWVPGSAIRLVRNPDYINVREDRNNPGAPYVDGIVFKNIPEIGTRIAALETDELNILGLSRESVPQFIDNPDYKVIIAEDTPSFNFVEFNYTRAPFDNPDFRRAFGLAIDKEAILLGAYGGYATSNFNPYPTGNPGYDPAIGEELGMPYDPETAVAMLEEMGWRDVDGDGMREADGVEGIEDGTPAAWTCWTYPFEIKQRECEIIQANMADIGVGITVQLTDFGTMSAEMPKGEFDFDVMRWTYNEPVILSLLFKCPGWKELFCDPELDELLIAAETEMDPVARLDLVKEIQRYLLNDSVIIPFATDWYLTATSADVNDLRYDATYGLTYDDVWISKP